MSILKGEFSEELPTRLPSHSGESALLERYLTDVENGLYPLTPGERRAELMELRAHLYAMVRANQELSPQFTEEEAAKAALEQFGPVIEVTAELVRVNREQKEAPLRQLGLALLTCLVGGALSYIAFIGLNFVQTPAPGVIRIISWPSGVVLVGAPLCLGTIIGRAFPRALHAWLPLFVAAVTWFFTSILSSISRALQHLIADLSGFWRLAEQRVFSIDTLYSLFFSMPVLISFLMLAWTAQSIARRSKSGRGFVGWCKEIFRYLPDTWLGGMALAMVIGRLLNLVTGPLQYLLKSGEVSASQLREPDITLLLANVALMTLQAAIGWGIVGYMLPRRGWLGSLYAVLLALVSTLMHSLFSPFTSNITYVKGSYPILWLLLTWVPTVVAVLAAYFVGKRRLKTP